MWNRLHAVLHIDVTRYIYIYICLVGWTTLFFTDVGDVPTNNASDDDDASENSNYYYIFMHYAFDYIDCDDDDDDDVNVCGKSD